jgi:hypothetical protein
MFNFPKSVLQPGDVICEGYYPELSENYYHHYFNQVKEAKASSVVEIGVRAGYSAYAMLLANPSMRYLGLDINSPNEFGFHDGAFEYAQSMLRKEFPKAKLKFKVQDTQKLDKLPGKFDLAHIDGDHSFTGCLHDLYLCENYVKVILVDDYDFVPSVRTAVDQFIAERGFKSKYIKNFRGMMVIWT